MFTVGASACYSRDGRTIYFAGVAALGGSISIGLDLPYLTVSEYESEILVASLRCLKARPA